MSNNVMKWAQGLLICCICVLSGCSSVTPNQGETVPLSQDVTLTLTPAPVQLKGQTWQQFLVIEHAQKREELMCQVQIDKQGTLKLIATTVAGLPLFSLAYSNDGVLRQLEFVPLDNIDPRYILADIQLVHWPLLQLQKSITGATLTESTHNSNKVRVLQNQQPLTIITYTSEHTTLENKLHNYRISFTQVSQ